MKTKINTNGLFGGARRAIATISLIGALLVTVLQPCYAESFTTVQGYGTDTIAGYSALISTSKTVPTVGVTFSVVKPNEQLRFPADMYLEGSDQHCGWF